MEECMLFGENRGPECPVYYTLMQLPAGMIFPADIQKIQNVFQKLAEEFPEIFSCFEFSTQGKAFWSPLVYYAMQMLNLAGVELIILSDDKKNYTFLIFFEFQSYFI